MRKLKLLAALIISPLLFLPAAQAATATYPDIPIRIIIGSAANSGPDIISRVLA